MQATEKSLSFASSVALSLAAWLVVIVFTITYSLGSIIFVLPFSLILDSGTRRLVHGVAQNWARGLLATSPVWSLQVEGLENIQAGKPYVIVANHQSMIDILVALAGLPMHFKFIAKQELFSVPFIGWHMALAGYIPLDRSSRESGRKAAAAARQWLAKNTSVLFFPEGTRSPDGEMRDFKSGAFKIAMEEGVEVLPVVIDGTGDALPKKSWRVAKTARFILSIGKPLRIGKGETEAVKVKDGIRGQMAERLAGIRGKSSAKGEIARSLKILTLNTWREGGPWRERWELIFEHLVVGAHGRAPLQPDIIGFQEVFDSEWVKEIQVRTGLPYLVFPAEPSGHAILSRFPVVHWDCLTMKAQSPTEDYLRYVLFAELRIEKEHLAFFDTHLSWRMEESETRQKQVGELLDFVKAKAADLETVIVGDFNSTADTAEIRRMSEEGKFVDAYDSLHPGEPGFTWNNVNSYTAGSHPKMPDRRIDYIWVRNAKSLLKNLKTVELVLNKANSKGVWPSDHFGAVAEWE